MDIELARIGVTVLSFAVFVGIAAWAYVPGQRDRFDAAAQLPFAEDAELEEGAK